MVVLPGAEILAPGPLCTGVRGRVLLGTWHTEPCMDQGPGVIRGTLSASGTQSTKYHTLWCRMKT